MEKMGEWNADDGAAGWENGGGTAAYNDENANPSGNSKDAGSDGDAWETSSAGNGQNDDNRCRNCGIDGHFARNCPEPRKGMACFNCGEEGHSKAECSKPRVFKGTCRVCNQEGHPAAQCPERPPDVCKNCKMEGHRTIDCKENRKFDLNNIPDKLPEEAWAAMQKASEERDLEDFREALKIYSKAVPDATFVDIENKMRRDNLNFYLIAIEKPIGDCISVINLQGKLDCKYVVGFYYSPKPQRANLKERWPESIEENLERLEDAGIPYDREIPKCSNCGEMGHTARGCKEEHVVHERVEVKCVNCSAVGHRARDCTEPRHDRFACRNCGSSEHKAAECPNPRSAEGVECKRCNEVGHFAKDCPQAPAPRTCRNCGSEDHIARDCDKPRDISTVTCRNCDEVGHFSRNCPKKRDWSKVKCNNCGQMGHTVKRCPSVTDNDTGMGDNPGLENNGNQNAAADGRWPTDNSGMADHAEAVPAEEGGWKPGW